MTAKYLLLPLCLLLIISTISCKKDNFQKKFGIRLDKNFDVPAGLDFIDAHFFVLNELPTFYSNIIAQEDVPDNATITIVPERAVITSLFGDVDFDFVERVSVRIFTNENVEDKPEAFYIEFIPNTVDGELELIPTSFDALTFLKGGLVNAEVKFVFKRTSPQLMNLRILMDFRGNY